MWDDPDRAQELGRQRASLEKIVNILSDLGNSLNDADELLEAVKQIPS